MLVRGHVTITAGHVTLTGAAVLLQSIHYILIFTEYIATVYHTLVCCDITACMGLPDTDVFCIQTFTVCMSYVSAQELDVWRKEV